ncbi:hypothetical protein M0R45_027030 [Rubus argutus]|uniref:Uncharacterized protein n=1 Tax=Rubus argutus TaxID=59490 RepID=A0AAW1X0W1_RUBAR
MEEVVAKNSTSQLTTLPDSITLTAKIILEILFQESPQQISPALAATGIVPTPDVVIEVLNLSYDYPFSAVKFFRRAREEREGGDLCFVFLNLDQSGPYIKSDSST